MKKTFLPLLFLFSLSFANGQAARLDSLQVFNQYDSLQHKPINEQLFLSMKNLEKLSEQINYIEGQSLTRSWIGSYYRQTGEYEKAIKQFQENLIFAEKHQDAASATSAHLDLANAYNDINNLDKATEYIEQFIEIAKATNNKKYLCLGLNTFGIIEMKQRKLKSALKQLLEAIKISEGVELPADFITTVNSNIGVIYVQLGKSEQAIQYFKEMLHINQVEKDTLNFAAAYGNIAYAYQNIQQFEQAFLNYDSSLYFSEKLGQDEVTYITYLDMSDGYKLKGDYKNALLYQKKYHHLYEKIINGKTQNNIAELEVKFETERKEKELLASQKEVTELEQSAKIRQQRMSLIIGSLIASIIIGFLIFFRAKSKAEQKEIAEKLIRSELKNKELEAKQLQSELTIKKSELTNKQSDLTNLALDIGRKNKFSNQLIDQLDKLKKLKPEEIKPQLREVISFAVNHLQINEANEKYLAGLVRLNLSNKDVAAIRGISASSAKMSRHRLRKKLGLNPEEDIVVFLQEV